MPGRWRIVSGGQTGVDRAALECAQQLGVPIGGWCPRDGWAEDLPQPPGVRALFPMLGETPTADPAQRTAWNVRDSDATLIVVIGGAGVDSPGTAFTQQAAELHDRRPCLVLDASKGNAVAVALAWLTVQMANTAGDEFVLNIAGPRASEAPGIHALATRFFSELFPAMQAD